ncbi:MAG: hypothetical protein ABW169_07305 [Sphingobium sp.]
MSNTHSTAGIVNVDGLTYEWQLQREPQWSDAEGWMGMTIALVQQDMQRGAVLEFPPPKRLLKGLPRGRLQINDAIVSRGVRAALLAGWEPASRGKPMVFVVDADGN